MKILIAEDDLVTRELLKRILKHMADEVIEAGDGLEALEKLSAEDPDFLFTDLQMPELDGKALLEAVRSSAAHRMLPVVCMSSVKDKAAITSLLALGIQDYVLKPIRAADVSERFRKVIAQHSGWRRRQASDTKPAVILVDPDASFREFCKPFLESAFSVAEASTGAQALRVYKEADPKPATVVVAKGLALVGELQLKTILTKQASDLRVAAPLFWLLTDDDELPADCVGHFEGPIQKSLVANVFSAELRRTLLKGVMFVDRLTDHLRDGGRKWALTAVRQALVTVSGNDVSRATSTEDAALAGGIAVRFFLDAPAARVRVVIGCTRDGAVSLAATGSPQGDGDECAAAALTELGSIVGSRARTALAERGFDLQLGMTDILTDFSTQADTPWHVSEIGRAHV